MRAAGLVCLGAGAGLIRVDLRDVRGTDVACRSGGVVVQVKGPRGHVVPVLARYHERLLAATGFAGNALICGGADPGRRNLTNPLVAALDGGGGLPRLDTSRLRATWLAEVADLLGPATFMAAAGISRFPAQVLYDAFKAGEILASDLPEIIANVWTWNDSPTSELSDKLDRNIARSWVLLLAS